MQKIFITLAIFLTAAGCKSINEKAYTPPTYDYSQELKIGNKVLTVEVVRDSQKMQQGLSSRKSMKQDQGMLFDFGDSSKLIPSFWMKDMDFDLDLIWIYRNKIIGITADVTKPDANCQSLTANCLPSYSPPSPINQVLEVNAGWSKKNNIKVGDSVNLGN